MLARGSRLGPYEIDSLIDKGGMGEVYRGRDTRLGRDVAVKVLPPDFRSDPQRRQRFEREARAVAALDHPNICPLYDVGEEEGVSFLVMQYLDGESLAQVLARGALPLERVVTCAIEIASALDAAHRSGVVHRDLKPGNILVTKSGVKIVDFGLARVSAPHESNVSMGERPTESASLTEPGTVLGTLAYMAPEQLEGRDVDGRTDIFALGAVVLEMMTGRRAFPAESRAGVIAAILQSDPFALESERVPPALRRVVAKCLAKDPDRRWQSAGDLAEAFRWVNEMPRPAAVRPGSSRWTGGRVALVAGIAAGLVGGVVWMLAARTGQTPALVPRVHFTVDVPPGGDLDSVYVALALSPAGDALVFTGVVKGEPQLFLRRLTELEATPISGTAGAAGPYFSPDGEWIGFTARGVPKKVAVAGGAPVTLPAGWENVQAWGPGDRMVVAASGRSPLSLMDGPTGASRPLTVLDATNGESSHRLASFLPDANAVLFTAGPPADGPWYQAQIAVQALTGSGRHQTLIRGGAQVRYAPSGHLVYGRAGVLYAVPFDPRMLRVTGQAVAVLDDVREDPSQGSTQFTIANNGTLAYISGGLISNELVWVDRAGRVLQVIGDSTPRLMYQPRLSPDGRQLAITVASGNDDIWIYTRGSGVFSRLTSGANHLFPSWTPDGRRVSFQRAETRELLWQSADRSTLEEVLLSDTNAVPHSWSPDGRFLTLTRTGERTGTDIWLMDVEKRTPTPLVETRFSEVSPMISPDGRWLAYASDESGRFQVYVQPFPKGGQRWPVSRDGGTEPLWSRDGKELYVRHDAQLMAVPAAPPFAGTRPLFELPWWALRFSTRTNYEEAPGGEGFLLLRTRDWEVAPRIHVILNWTDELHRRVPRSQ